MVVVGEVLPSGAQTGELGKGAGAGVFSRSPGGWTAGREVPASESVREQVAASGSGHTLGVSSGSEEYPAGHLELASTCPTAEALILPKL